MTGSRSQRKMRIEKARSLHYKEKNRVFREDFYSKPGRKCRLSEISSRDLKVGKFSIGSWFSENYNSKYADSDYEDENNKFCSWTKLKTTNPIGTTHSQLYSYFPNKEVDLNEIFDSMVDDWVKGGWTLPVDAKERKKEYKRDEPLPKTWKRIEYNDLTKETRRKSKRSQFITGPIDTNHGFNFPKNLKHSCKRPNCCL